MIKNIIFAFFAITLSIPLLAKTSYSTEIKAPEIEVDPGVEFDPKGKIKFELDDKKKSSSSEDLQQKAIDYRRAFRMLKQQNPSGKIYIIANGVSIEKIEDFRVMPNGTLIMLTLRSKRGYNTKIINTEDISEIGQH